MVLRPKDHREEVALFRAQVLGPLLCRELSRGERLPILVLLSQQRYRPPRSRATRTYAVPTLERWFYAHRKGGLEALKPKERSDRGHAHRLDEPMRKLLLSIRREHPTVSAPVIIRTLELDGRLDEGLLGPATLRRLYAQNGLNAAAVRLMAGGKARRRWQADKAGALWHADVMHGPSIWVDGKPRRIRVHAILDDATRYIIRIEAQFTEREVYMLWLLADAVRAHGVPKALYLDNGSTYSGKQLAVVCGRMGTSLIHARPYDPQARGKMERFWRTLRQQCIDHMGKQHSLHDVNVRMWSYLDRHYHDAPHAGLLGRSPSRVYAEQRPETHVDKAVLREAFTVRDSRKVRKDGTIAVDGSTWELEQGFLAGRRVLLVRCLLDAPPKPWVEYDSKRFALHPLDPVKNARRPRIAATKPEQKTPFDPAKAMLDRAVGKTPKKEKKS